MTDRKETDRDHLGAAVVATGLTKEFRGNWTFSRKRAVDGLSLTIERGQIYGLLGPNGSGKTTTLKMLLGLLAPTAGSAWLLGMPAGTPESRKGIGYLPEQPYFYDRLTAREFLVYSGRLAGLDRADSQRRAESWLGRLGLAKFAKVRLRKFSKGMLQRIGLAHALLAEPDLVFLDEPMSGLDPAGRREFREIILDCRQRGVTVVFSSHILPDAELLCDEVGVLSSGKLARRGTLDELLSDGQGAADIVVRGGKTLLLPPRFASVAHRLHGDHWELHIPDSSLLQDLLLHLIRERYEIVTVQTRRRSLEEVVLECVGGVDPIQARERMESELVGRGEERRTG